MRKTKKMAAAVVAAGMLLATPVWAAEKPVPAAQQVQAVQTTGGAVQVSSPGAAKAQQQTLTQAQKQALEKLYPVLPELKKLTVRHVATGEKSWSVMLTDRVPQKDFDIRTVNANLTFDAATGELLSFDINNPKWASDQVPDAALAKEKVAQFVRAVLGERAKGYQASGSLNYGSSGTGDAKGNTITWARAGVQYNCLINGVPLLNSGFQVGVDAFGHIVQFFMRENDTGLDSAQFPDPARVVKPAAAEKTFAGMLDMQLLYNARHPSKLYFGGPSKGETRPVLMYAPTFMAPIDALSGKPLPEYMGSQTQAKRITLSGEGRQLIARTPEEAAALLTKQFGVDMSGMQLQNAEERLGFLGEKTKEYTWFSQPKPPKGGMENNQARRYVHMTTLDKTGRVIGFNLQDDTARGQQGTVSQEAALKTADQFLKKTLPSGTTELVMNVNSFADQTLPAWVDKSKLKAGQQMPPVISFNFNRVHQGVPVVDSSLSIQVDARNGKIIGFNDSFNDLSIALPDNKNVVSAQAAKTEFLKQHPLQLVYVWPEFFGQKAPSPKLLYVPEFGSGLDYFDAFTGKTVTLQN